MYFYGARYYDPSLGAFITPDTIVPYPDDPQSFNRYAMARRNPIRYIDPTGHFFRQTFFTIRRWVSTGINSIGRGINSFFSGVGGAFNRVFQIPRPSVMASLPPPGGWGSRLASRLDFAIDTTESVCTFTGNAFAGEDWVRSGSIATAADMLHGTADLLRLGESSVEGEEYWKKGGLNNRLLAIGKFSEDISRAAGIGAIVAGAGYAIANKMYPKAGITEKNFYQYYPKDNPSYKSRYMIRGNKPPYKPGKEAYDALNLKASRGPNPGNAVKNVKVKPWEPVRGPRPVEGGTGWEYYRGWRWPWQ